MLYFRSLDNLSLIAYPNSLEPADDIAPAVYYAHLAGNRARVREEGENRFLEANRIFNGGRYAMWFV